MGDAYYEKNSMYTFNFFSNFIAKEIDTGESSYLMFYFPHAHNIETWMGLETEARN